MRFVPGTGAEHGRGDRRRLPDAARRPRSRRPHRARRRRHLACASRPSTPLDVHGRGRERRPHAGPARRAPVVRAAAAVRRRPTQDLELAEAVAAAGVEFVALSFVRRAADVRRAARGRRRPRRHRRQDRDRVGARRAGRDPRGRRRGDGGPRRPRHRLPARGRAAPPEADHPPLRRASACRSSPRPRCSSR